MTTMRRLKSDWTALKIIRVCAGVLILYSSVQSGHIAGMILGGLFTAFALFSNGVCCAAAGSCYKPDSKTSAAVSENIDIEYEELGHK